MNNQSRDRELGMDRNITRRDFLNGFAIAVGGSLLSPSSPWLHAFGMPHAPYDPEQNPHYYPPALTGMRGDHDGSWEVAHHLVDGAQWEHPVPLRESYDLIVVGGGLSGLSCAYFFRKLAGPKARVLVIENHDDFGGHAKRNEFHSGSRLIIGYGGTQSIASPDRYSPQALGLLTDLGIHLERFHHYFDQDFFASRHLTRGVFFDKETFGTDKLVPGMGEPSWRDFLVKTPLPEAAQRDIVRLFSAKVDYLPGLSRWEKKVRLAKTSYKDYLLNYVKVHPDVIPFFQKQTYGLYGVGIDAVPAGDLAGLGYPGFQGMDLSGRPGPGLGVEDTREDPRYPYIFHFPDGNASIARLLVRSLIPGAAPGHTMEDIVTASMDYARLDDSSSPVRIRLNSTVVHASNVGGPERAQEVKVEYVRGGQAYSVRGANCVLACWNMVIPFLCPEMPQKQKDALAYGEKIPLAYTNVQIRNWESLQELGTSGAYCPGSYWDEVTLDFPVNIGGYRYASSPRESCLLHLSRAFCGPGDTARKQQVAGRWVLFSTTFDDFERSIREQLGRMFSTGGFDPARDIEAITVNRWPHGYAYEYNSLYDPDWPPEQRPCVIGRQPFGRIHIANSDAEAMAYTNAAIDQGYRASQEIIARKA